MEFYHSSFKFLKSVSTMTNVPFSIVVTNNSERIEMLRKHKISKSDFLVKTFSSVNVLSYERLF